MSALALVAALALPVLGAPKPTLAFQGRTELRLREPGDPRQGGDFTTASSESADVEVSGGVTLGVRRKRWTFELGYGPRFTVANFAIEPIYELLHTGTATIGYRWSRVTLVLSEVVTYGDRSYYSFVLPPGVGGAKAGGDAPAPAAPAPAMPAPAGQATTPLVPRSTKLHYVSSTTSLASNITLSTRSTLALGVGYAIGGGADTESRRVLPITKGPYAGGVWGYVLGHGNSLATTVGASYTTTTPEAPAGGGAAPVETRTFLATASEAWTRQWARRTVSTVGVGAGVGRTTPGAEDLKPYPGASATLTHGILTGPRGALLVLGAGATLAPVLDPLTGQVDRRLDLVATATWHIRHTTLFLGASRGQSIDPDQPNAAALTSAELGVRQDLSAVFALEGGARVFKQTVSNQDPPGPATVYTGLTWSQYVALVITPKPLKL